MAWTAPRTWVNGETETASILNTHIRDNFLQTAPAVVTTRGDTVSATGANALERIPIFWLSADEGSRNSITLSDITGWTFAVAGADAWGFEGHIYYTCTTTGGLNIAWSTPAGWVEEMASWGASAFDSVVAIGGASTVTKGNRVGTNGANGSSVLSFRGAIYGAGTSGTAKLQAAQATAAGTTTTKKGSWLRIFRLA